MSEEAEKKNPIHKDFVAENPGLLPYAHHLGSAIIKPIDKGKVKGVAMTAMYQQTGNQLNQLKEQIETLVKQAQDLHDRIGISEMIYKADCGFKPMINQTYYLYEKEAEKWILSMVSPTEWGKNSPYVYIATVELFADHTWEVLDSAKSFSEI